MNAGPGQAEVLQNRANKWAGLFLGVGGWGLLALSDPLLVTEGARAGYGGSVNYVNVCAVLACMTLSIGGLRCFWRPRVVLCGEVMHVINPLREYLVPRASIKSFDVEGRRYPIVMTAQRVIRLVGVEHSLRMQLWVTGHRLTASLKGIDTDHDPGNEGAGHQIDSWSKLTPVEIVSLIGWIVALGVVILKWILQRPELF